MKINILLTGAGGFVGRHFLQGLSSERYHIYAVDLKPIEDIQLPNVEFVIGNIFDFEQFDALFSKCDILIFTVGEKRNTANMRKVNVEGALLLMNHLQKFPKLKLIYLSSAGVYGLEQQSELIISENTAPLPQNEYERTKYEGESIVRKWAHDYQLKTAILRPSNVFGEWEPENKLLNLFKMLEKGNFLFLDKKAILNYCYVKTIVNVCDQFIVNDLFDNQVFNINSPIENYRFISQTKQFLGLKNKNLIIPGGFKVLFYWLGKLFDHLPKKIQYFNSIKYNELTQRKIIDVAKLDSTISYHPQEELLAGVKNLIEFYKKENKLR